MNELTVTKFYNTTNIIRQKENDNNKIVVVSISNIDTWTETEIKLLKKIKEIPTSEIQSLHNKKTNEEYLNHITENGYGYLRIIPKPWDGSQEDLKLQDGLENWIEFKKLQESILVEYFPPEILDIFHYLLTDYNIYYKTKISSMIPLNFITTKSGNNIYIIIKNLINNWYYNKTNDKFQLIYAGLRKYIILQRAYTINFAQQNHICDSGNGKILKIRNYFNLVLPYNEAKIQTKNGKTKTFSTRRLNKYFQPEASNPYLNIATEVITYDNKINEDDIYILKTKLNNMESIDILSQFAFYRTTNIIIEYENSTGYQFNYNLEQKLQSENRISSLLTQSQYFNDYNRWIFYMDVYKTHVTQFTHDFVTIINRKCDWYCSNPLLSIKDNKMAYFNYKLHCDKCDGIHRSDVCKKDKIMGNNTKVIYQINKNRTLKRINMIMENDIDNDTNNNQS